MGSVNFHARRSHPRAVCSSRLAPPLRVFTTVKSAAAGALDNSETQLLALEKEIMRLTIAARIILADKANPHDDEFYQILDGDGSVLGRKERCDAAFEFSHRCGRDAAITAAGALEEQAAPIFERLMSIRTTTQASRAAKVRTLMIFVLPDDWHAPKLDDWSNEQVRNLLAEFAGMSAEEIANV
jgi:hypothetical protein